MPAGRRSPLVTGLVGADKWLCSNSPHQLLFRPRLAPAGLEGAARGAESLTIHLAAAAGAQVSPGLGSGASRPAASASASASNRPPLGPSGGRLN